MKLVTAQLVHPFPSKRLPRWFLVLLGVSLIAASVTAYPILKAKLTHAPVYKPSANTALVDLKEIENNVKGNQIVIVSPGEKALLPGAKWIPQTFNNCGPASTSMVLQYFGKNVDQNTTKAALRTNSDDKNVFLYEISGYLKQTHNIDSKLMYNGDRETMKLLIANGFYVVVEDWLHPNEDIGHVLIIKGFDDKQGVFIADDSYLGINITYKYEEFDEKQWKPFNREFMPVYTSDKEPLLKAIVGKNWDEKQMYQNSVEKNLADVQKDPKDIYAWFNLGSSYFALGEYEKAKEAFEKSQALGWPKRMLWYQIQPIQNYTKLGEYQKALDLTQKGLWSNDSFAELHYQAAISYQGLGNTQKAKEELQKALQYAPNYQEAKVLLSSL